MGILPVVSETSQTSPGKTTITVVRTHQKKTFLKIDPKENTSCLKNAKHSGTRKIYQPDTDRMLTFYIFAT